MAARATVARMTTAVLIWTLIGVMAISTAHAADAKRTSVGALSDGSAIDALTLYNARGISARTLTYGATLRSLIGPDRNGKLADIALDYDDIASHVDRYPGNLDITVTYTLNETGGLGVAFDSKTDKPTFSSARVDPGKPYRHEIIYRVSLSH